MKMFTARLKVDGRRFRAKTRAELLSKMRKYLWKYHRSYMLNRMASGRRAAALGNPTVQDVAQAIQKGSTRAALAVSRQMTEQRYQQVKKVMDAVAPMLPLKAQTAWEGVEAAHDLVGKFKRKGGSL